MTEMEKWLGGEFGRDDAKPLRGEMYKNFLIGAAKDVWTLDDVPDASKEGTLDGPEMARCVKFMSTILTDCHKVRGSTDPPTPVELARLEDWLVGRYQFVDVSLATASKAAAAAMSAECHEHARPRLGNEAATSRTVGRECHRPAARVHLAVVIEPGLEAHVVESVAAALSVPPPML